MGGLVLRETLRSRLSRVCVCAAAGYLRGFGTLRDSSRRYNSSFILTLRRTGWTYITPPPPPSPAAAAPVAQVQQLLHSDFTSYWLDIYNIADMLNYLTIAFAASGRIILAGESRPTL